MTSTIAPDIAEFAAAVRAELADLPPEELDDLLDGLDADLAERLEESPDAELGDPVAYAAELRAAAGYPARSTGRARGLDAAVLARWSELRADWTAFVARHRFVRGAVDLVVSLRPAWWVYRGWALFALLASTVFGVAAFPGHVFSWLLLIAAVVLSVQVGRRVWLRHRVARGVVVALDVLLVLLTPAIVAWAVNSVQNAAAASDGATWYPGQLEIDGRPIDNIFAYDEHGEPIERVQLFDQDGNPLNLVSDATQPFWYSGSGILVPSLEVPGRAGWNVYPLGHADESDLATVAGDGGSVEPTPTKHPLSDVKPLADAEQPSEGEEPLDDESVATPAD